MDKLKDKLWEELDKIDRKEELNPGDLELAHKLSDTIKYILLSALYNIRDKLSGDAPAVSAYSMQAQPAQGEQVGRYGDSDFLRSVEGKDPAAVWGVLDEHMETLRVVQPRAHEGVMRKLNRL